MNDDSPENITASPKASPNLLIISWLATILIGYYPADNLYYWLPETVFWLANGLHAAFWDGVFAGIIWWLSMLRPHSGRSVVAPLAMYAFILALRPFLCILAWGIAIFPATELEFFFKELIDYWLPQCLALDVVIGVTIYLYSKYSRIALVCQGTAPLYKPLNVASLFGLTALLAIAIFLLNFLYQPPTDWELGPSKNEVFITTATYGTAIGWTWCLIIWAFRQRTIPKIIVAVALALYIQVTADSIFDWLSNNYADQGVGFGAISNIQLCQEKLIGISGIILAVRFTEICGYQLVKLDRLEANENPLPTLHLG